MARFRAKNILVFVLGMLTFAIGAWLGSTFLLPERPIKDGMIEDWDQICFWPDADGTLSFYFSQGLLFNFLHKRQITD